MLQSSQLVLTICKGWRERKSLKSESKSTNSGITKQRSYTNREEKSFLNEINSVNSCKTVRNVAGLEKSWKFQKTQNHCDNDDGNQTKSSEEKNKILGPCTAPQDVYGTSIVREAAEINKSVSKELEKKPLEADNPLVILPSVSAENIGFLSLHCDEEGVVDGDPQQHDDDDPGATKHKNDIIEYLSNERISEISPEVNVSDVSESEISNAKERTRLFPSSISSNKSGYHENYKQITYSSTSQYSSSYLQGVMGQTAMSSPSLIMLGQVPTMQEKGVNAAFNQSLSEDFPSRNVGKSPELRKRSEVITWGGGKQGDDSELLATTNTSNFVRFDLEQRFRTSRNFGSYRDGGEEGDFIKSPSYLHPAPPPTPPDVPGVPPPPAQGGCSGPDLTISASPPGEDTVQCVVKDSDKKQTFLETHFGCEATTTTTPPVIGAGRRGMVDSVVRRLDGREAIHWGERGEMIDRCAV